MITGLERIQETFREVRAHQRAALMPYFTAGFPTRPTSLDIIQAIAESGADLIELGVPFSDPLADGPTIQHSAQIALENGTDFSFCLDTVRELRRRGVQQPVILMSYFNPILANRRDGNFDHLMTSAVTAGVDGFIIPDLPPEEAGELEEACHRYGCALIYLLAPTSPPERIEMIVKHCTGFIYLVSLIGVTGARQSLAGGLHEFVERVQTWTDLPLAVGFGVSTPEQAHEVGHLAEGVIVGSALIDAVDNAADPCLAAAAFVKSFRQSLDLPH